MARQFGHLRKLPSGRWQASYIGPGGRRRTAPRTFRTKTDGRTWLSMVEADLVRGTWMDDQLGRESFGNYARGWLRDHPTMGERYRETCLRNLRLHLADLEDVQLRAMTPVLVRTWLEMNLRYGLWLRDSAEVHGQPSVSSHPRATLADRVVEALDL